MSKDDDTATQQKLLTATQNKTSFLLDQSNNDADDGIDEDAVHRLYFPCSSSTEIGIHHDTVDSNSGDAMSSNERFLQFCFIRENPLSEESGALPIIINDDDGGGGGDDDDNRSDSNRLLGELVLPPSDRELMHQMASGHSDAALRKLMFQPMCASIVLDIVL